ncbi:proton-conducting transporter transmembrane domain-containing protein [Biostraticola tofi]|uniref:Formate hydrogenlyase subunit 3 n=1 Tax=Biostraticola tofi TaxID=466109 RepID=A0A4V2W5C9_9GAMM|nr:proton-conducting transporter membrane subunit [Biostraticola tofi]TCV99264.1 formate hydrogenlyase subunit 3 [Biostraticola tofi]
MNPLFTDPLQLLTISLTGYLLLAVLGILLSPWPRVCAWTGAGTVIAALASLIAAWQMRFTVPQHASLPWLGLGVEQSGLNALLLLVVAVSALWLGLYHWGWLATVAARRRARIASLSHLMLAALSAAVMADNAVTLTLMLELSALAGYFLVVQPGEAKSQAAGHSQFLLARLATLLLIAAFSLLYLHLHSLQFSVIRTAQLPDALRNAVFLLALGGFGIVAGIMPLHGWAPSSHGSAPASVAMLFSSVQLKIGLLGILRISLDVLGTPSLWWGLLVLILAAGTAFFGGLYALMEHDLRRLLAYHSLENVGIILLGIGGAMVGITLQMPLLAMLALTGGLFHLFNHSLFKGALLLAAGAIEQQTGLKDLEKMGGLARLMPWTAGALLTGLIAMAALPPLNGFASEWLIYQGLFTLGTGPGFVLHLLGPLLAVVLAITGALALMCISKVFGVCCLGAPRTEAALGARPAHRLVTLSALLPAILCLLCGIGAPWLIPLFAATAAELTGYPSAAPIGLVSAPLIALLLLSMPLLPLLIAAVYRRKRLPPRLRGSAWACGYGHEASMVVTATGFAQPLRVLFAPLYQLRRWLMPSGINTLLHRQAVTTFCHGLAAVELAVLLVVALA